jgi:hypothetical protein
MGSSKRLQNESLLPTNGVQAPERVEAAPGVQRAIYVHVIVPAIMYDRGILQLVR